MPGWAPTEASKVQSRWLFILFFSLTLVAEGRTPLPLMPEREPEVPLTLDETLDPLPPARSKFAFLDAQEQKRPRSRAPSYSRVATQPQRNRAGSLLMGFEMGAQGRANSTSSDALGLKLLLGGRAFLVFPVASRVFLKPSIGFFYRHEGAAKVGISEHMAEAGLNAQYAFSQSGGMNWMIGLANRLEVSFSKTSISTLTASATPTSTSDSSAALLRYRMGPSLGMTHRLTPTIGLVIDAEMTFSFTNPVKPYGGLAGGLIFKL